MNCLKGYKSILATLSSWESQGIKGVKTNALPAQEDVAAVGLELQVDLDHAGRDVDSVQRRGHRVVDRGVGRRHQQGVGHQPRGRELNGEHAGVAIEPALGLHLGKPVGPTTTKDNNLTTLITVRAVVGICRQTYPQQEDADDCNFFLPF